MKIKLHSALPWALVGLATGLFAALAFQLNRIQGRSEPDYYLHVAVTKLAALGGGILRSLPQAEGLGWGRLYPDKEFVFHQILRILHFLGGEPSISWAVPLLAGLNFLVVAWLLARFLGPGRAAALAFVGLALSQPFLWRMSLLRPHLLGVFFFLALVAALLSRRALWVGVCAALFAVSYHAFYLPLVLLALSFFLRAERPWRLAAAGVAGVVVGVVVHPFFPSYLLLGLSQANIALVSAGNTPSDFGTELIPISTKDFALQFAFFLAALFYCVHRLGSLRSDSARFLLAAAAAFWALALYSPRAVEYAAPLGVLALGAALGAARPRRAVFAAFLAAGVLLQAENIRVLSARLGGPAAEFRHERVARELALIPKGAKVFNCSWGEGSHILYARPDLRFVDLMDPKLLRDANPRLHEARQALVSGREGDPDQAVRSLFGASHVLCRERLEALERHPNYRRLNAGEPFVYERGEGHGEELAWAMGPSLVQELPPGGPGDFLEQKPLDASWVETSLPRYAAFPGGLTGVRCVAMKPKATRAGATILGVGGGRHLRVWLNGRPLFSTREPAQVALMVERFVRLPRPLGAGDEIVAVACAQEGLPYHGLSLSYWTDEAITKVCAWKGQGELPYLREREPWAQVGGRENCLAPFASAGMPSKSRAR